jgi:hypothetical protein
MADSPADVRKEDLVEVLIQLIRGQRANDAISVIDAHEDPTAVGSAFNSTVKNLYRRYHDVTSMIAAGDMGLAYCLSKAALESDDDKRRELKKLGKVIAFNTAANCWPGWGDAGIVVEEAQIEAGIKLATQSRDLVLELALEPRKQGTAHWLVGALELAAGRSVVARVAFERAEQAFLTDDTTACSVLMARGYVALARKADPSSHVEGADMLSEILERLRADGSKEAIFFADQLVTADRVLDPGSP